jgi:hypothetical protein
MPDFLLRVAGLFDKRYRDMGDDSHAEVVAAALERQERAVTATIPAGGALSDAIDMQAYAMGTVHMPAAWDPASLGFKVSTTLAGTYLPLYDESGALVQIASPAVDQAYTLPARVAACRFVKLWSQNGAGVDVNQTAARSLPVDLKA